MANEQNLIKNEELTPSERRENAKKAGKASGEKRKEKKMLRELLEEALRTKTKSGNKYIDITNALIEQAENGNVKAYETIRDTLGQKPREQIEHSGNINNPFSQLTTEELRQLIKDE